MMLQNQHVQLQKLQNLQKADDKSTIKVSKNRTL